MVRVAGLLDQVVAGVAVRSPDGRTPQQALAEARKRVLELDAAAVAGSGATSSCPALAAEGIVVGGVEDATADGARRARERASSTPDLPRADTARRRAGPAVPLHLRPLAQPRRHRARPGVRRGALRPREGARGLPRFVAVGDARPARPARERAHRTSCRLALPRDGDRRARRVPRHARRRHRDLRRRRRPARGGRERAAQRAASARSCASRSRARSRSAMLRAARSSGSRVADDSSYPITACSTSPTSTSSASSTGPT